MVQALMPNSLKRILMTSLVLMIIGTFAIIAFGYGLIDTHEESNRIEKFIKIAGTSKVNFEDSLVMYTEKTRSVVGYLQELRPSSEEGYITFISQVEDIGQALGLIVKLEATKSVESQNNKSIKAKKEDTITYNMSFFGSISDLKIFLSKLESLPYFVAVSNVSFRNLKAEEITQNSLPNINISIKLYTKNNDSISES
jgi:hypothetical protein